MKNELDFATKALLNPSVKKDVHRSINTAIYRSAAFEFETAEAISDAFQYKEKVFSHTYSRITNPTVDALEKRIQAIANADSVTVVSSGMAAISNAFMAIAYAGSNIVASPHLFGNTFSFFKFTLEAFGVEIRFVDTDNLTEIENAIDENTCAFFCELITNPHLEIADLPKISEILKRHHVPMIVDTTIIPWCGFEARKWGVDIEVVSTTKYVSGGATSIGGAILDYGTFDWSNNKRLCQIKSDELSPFMFKIKREIARNFGANMDPDTAYLQLLGLETLDVRYEKVTQNAFEIAEFLSTQEKVLHVGYTELQSSPYKALSDKMIKGHPGAMVTFNLESREACFAFMNKLKIIKRATNLFDNKSLIIHPESTIYGTFSDELKEIMGIDKTLIRFSVGLENINDLKNDIEDALK